MGKRKGVLQGETLKILEGTTVDMGSQLGITPGQVSLVRSNGRIYPTAKVAKALTIDKFDQLFAARSHKLTEKQRQVFEMVYYDRMGVRETANKLGISGPAVSDRLGRARLNLIGWPRREKVRKLAATAAWGRLSTLQKELVTLRYGLGDGLQPQSFEEISQSMKRSKNWAAQAIVSALNMLLFDE